MKRIILLVLAALLAAVLAAAAWLLTTTAGARWVAAQARQVEPRLELEVVSGNLWEGVDLRQLSWQQPDLRLNVPQASLRWRPNCLSLARVCLDRVELRQPRLEIDTSEAADAPAATEPAGPLLPLAVRLGELVLVEPRVRVDQTRVAAQRLRLEATLAGRQLRVGALDSRGLRIDLPPGDQPPAATAAGAAAAPLALPNVDLPLDVALQGVALEDVELRRGEEQWQLRRLALAGSLSEGHLRLRSLELLAPDWQFAAEGKAQLRDAYPLALNARLELDLPELPAPVRLQARLSESLERLQLAVDAEGPVQASLRGILQPLEPQLPFQLRLRSSELPWPPAEPQLRLEDLDLTLSGDRQRYAYRGEGLLSTPELEAAEIVLQGEGDLQGLRAEQLEVAALGGQISGQARLAWAPQLEWSAVLQAEGLDPARLQPQWPGRLGGQLTVVGGASAEGWRLSARSLGFGGELRGYPAQLTGTVHRTTEGLWQVDQLRLSSGDNRLRVDGEAGQRWDLRAALNFDAVEALLPQASGSLSGSLRVQGALERPDVVLNLASRGLRIADTAIASGTVEGRVAALARQPSRLQWRLAQLQVGEQDLGTVTGGLAGTLSQHELELELAGGRYGGAVTVRGGLEAWQSWQGELTGGELSLPHQDWLLAEPVELRWAQTQPLAVEAHCWRQQDARLCLQEEALVGPSGALTLQLRNYRVDRLQPWLPAGLQWSGPLQASARIDWAVDRPPRLSLEARSDQGRLRLRPVAEEPPLELDYQGLGLDLAVVERRLQAQLRLESEAMGDAYAQIEVDLQPGERPLQGEVRLAGLRLEPIEPLFPQIRQLQGRLSAEGRLGGTLRDPSFTGRVSLADGMVTAPALPMAPTEIALQLEVAGQRAELSGSFVSGGGRAQLSGEASWVGEQWSLQAGLVGQSLRVADRPLYELQVSPDLQLRAQPGQLSLSGVLRIPEGQITLASLPSQAVAVSQDVVIVQPGTEQQGQAPEPEPEPGPLADWDVDTRIEVILGDDVELSGYGLAGRLEGRLRLRQLTREAPEASGEIRVVDGRYEAYGQKLKIRQGQLLFAGPLTDPRLNVEAVREVGDVVAGVRITGGADDPQVELFSEPTMPQDEILSYLIRGRPPGTPGGDSGNLLAQAALALGVYGGKGYASRFAEELGVENFALGTAGEGEEAQVVFSGYLSPNLYLSYGVGVFQPQNTLTLRYQLSDRLYLEAVNGLESALDVFYQFEFGGDD